MTTNSNPGNAPLSDAITQAILQEIVIGESQTWSPSQNVEAIITVIGGGATGGLALSTTAGVASGGQAGGFSQKKVTLSKAINYILTVAAGGARVVATGVGNDGGQSSFVGGDVNMIVPGGTAGDGAIAAGASSKDGGDSAVLPSGGDINRVGGFGGISTKVANASARAAASGGAVDIWGVNDTKGGDAVINELTSTNLEATSGAGGVGGQGGDIAFGVVPNDTNLTAPSGSTLKSGEFVINVAATEDPTPGIYGVSAHVPSASILSPTGGGIREPGCHSGTFGGSVGDSTGDAAAGSDLPGLGGGSGGAVVGAGGFAESGGNGVIIIQILRVL